MNSVLSAIVSEVECVVDGCQTCTEYKDHQIKQNISRFGYKNDIHLYDSRKSEMIAAVDMKKVVMLPRMPGVKKAIFTK